MKKNLFYGLLAVLLAFGLAFTACDSDSGGGSDVINGTDTGSVSFIGPDATGKMVEVTISREGAATFNPATGDAYAIKYDGAEVSRGTITVDGTRIYFHPTANPNDFFAGTLIGWHLEIPAIPYAGGEIKGFTLQAVPTGSGASQGNITYTAVPVISATPVVSGVTDHIVITFSHPVANLTAADISLEGSSTVLVHPIKEPLMVGGMAERDMLYEVHFTFSGSPADTDVPAGFLKLQINKNNVDRNPVYVTITSTDAAPFIPTAGTFFRHLNNDAPMAVVNASNVITSGEAPTPSNAGLTTNFIRFAALADYSDSPVTATEMGGPMKDSEILIVPGTVATPGATPTGLTGSAKVIGFVGDDGKPSELMRDLGNAGDAADFGDVYRYYQDLAIEVERTGPITIFIIKPGVSTAAIQMTVFKAGRELELYMTDGTTPYTSGSSTDVGVNFPTIRMHVMDGISLDTGFSGNVSVTISGATESPNESFGTVFALTPDRAPSGRSTELTVLQHNMGNTIAVEFREGVGYINLRLAAATNSPNSSATSLITFSVHGVERRATETFAPRTLTGRTDVASLKLTTEAEAGPINATPTVPVAFAVRPEVTTLDRFGNIAAFTVAPSGANEGVRITATSTPAGALTGTGAYITPAQVNGVRVTAGVMELTSGTALTLLYNPTAVTTTSASITLTFTFSTDISTAATLAATALTVQQTLTATQ
ncbi:MAG: hypothetical protein FWH19_00945 [Treponema sp.]|nr:hypothetical protein [Treponema sp.]